MDFSDLHYEEAPKIVETPPGPKSIRYKFTKV